jgi:hypothetical protein
LIWCAAGRSPELAVAAINGAGGAQGGGGVLVCTGWSGLQFIGGARGIDLHLDAQEGAREQADIAAWQGLPSAAASVGPARRI